jgi:hypothetical protein
MLANPEQGTRESRNPIREKEKEQREKPAREEETNETGENSAWEEERNGEHAEDGIVKIKNVFPKSGGHVARFRRGEYEIESEICTTRENAKIVRDYIEKFLKDYEGGPKTLMNKIWRKHKAEIQAGRPYPALSEVWSAKKDQCSDSGTESHQGSSSQLGSLEDDAESFSLQINQPSPSRGNRFHHDGFGRSPSPEWPNPTPARSQYIGATPGRSFQNIEDIDERFLQKLGFNEPHLFDRACHLMRIFSAFITGAKTLYSIETVIARPGITVEKKNGWWYFDLTPDSEQLQRLIVYVDELDALISKI